MSMQNNSLFPTTARNTPSYAATAAPNFNRDFPQLPQASNPNLTGLSEGLGSIGLIMELIKEITSIFGGLENAQALLAALKEQTNPVNKIQALWNT